MGRVNDARTRNRQPLSLYYSPMNNKQDQSQTATRPNDKEGELLFPLLHSARVLEDRMENAFEAIGLSSAKYGVLAQLAEAGEPLPLSELAARLSCVRSNMTQLVDRLEGDGFVRRVNDPSDRRVVRAELTDLGRGQAHAGAQQLAGMQAEFAALLSPSDREALVRVLSALP